MPIAYHVIFSCYGFWLPNDPRGSWSEFTAKWELYLAGGKATKTCSPISVAGAPHDARFRMNVKKHLDFPPYTMNGYDARAAAHGFRTAVAEGDYECFACSILPEHVHLVIREHPRYIGRTVAHLKTRSRQAIAREKPGGIEQPVWADGYWKSFLYTPLDVQRAVKYVAANPEKEGKERQEWTFVKRYNPE
jgi:REP element-mobilizing transposase RayT